jgi:hypothetical protein
VDSKLCPVKSKTTVSVEDFFHIFRFGRLKPIKVVFLDNQRCPLKTTSYSQVGVMRDWFLNPFTVAYPVRVRP